MSTVSTDYQDITVEAIEKYLGDEMTLEDLADMDSEERQAYFSSRFTQLNLDDTTIEAFLDALDEELGDWELYLHTQYKELDAIIDSGDPISVADAATIEYVMNEISEIKEMCSGDAVDDAEDAEDIYNEHNHVLEDNDSYTATVTNPETGEVYNIDASCDDKSNEFTSAWSADNSDGTLADVNDDGKIEEDEVWDIDGDNRADYDLNGDGVIDETDNPNYSDGSNGSTVTIPVPDGATAYVMNSSEDPAETRIKITLEDGTYYYYNITGNPKIIMEAPTNANDLPPYLSQRMYESAEYDQSYYESMTGEGVDLEGGYFTEVKMSDPLINNTYPIAPTEADWENGRDYSIEFQDGVTDTLNLTFPEDAQLEFSMGDNGELIITATNSNGDQITITISNWYANANEGAVNSDIINIYGGIINSSDYSDLNFLPSRSASNASCSAAAMIFYDEDEGKNLYDAASDDGYTWGDPSNQGGIMPGTGGQYKSPGTFQGPGSSGSGLHRHTDDPMLPNDFKLKDPSK